MTSRSTAMALLLVTAPCMEGSNRNSHGAAGGAVRLGKAFRRKESGRGQIGRAYFCVERLTAESEGFPSEIPRFNFKRKPFRQPRRPFFSSDAFSFRSSLRT